MGADPNRSPKRLSASISIFESTATFAMRKMETSMKDRK